MNSSDNSMLVRCLDVDERKFDILSRPGVLYGLRISNMTSTVHYVKLYAATAANVVLGTTVPFDTIPVPANSSDYTVMNLRSGDGVPFTPALSIAATTGIADSNTGAPATGAIAVTAHVG